MDRLRVLRTINNLPLGLSLNEALILADSLHAEFAKPRERTYDLNTHEGLLAFAKSLPAVMNNLPDRKIHAIKELRVAAQAKEATYSDGMSASYISLKECKDVIDALAPGSWQSR